MLILVDDKRSDRQPILLLKQADVTTETAREQSTVSRMYEGCARNAVSQTLGARARCNYQVYNKER